MKLRAKMSSKIERFISIFSKAERIAFLRLACLAALSALIEAFSVALLIPLFSAFTASRVEDIRFGFVPDRIFIDFTHLGDLRFIFCVLTIVSMAFSTCISMWTRKLLLRFSYGLFPTLSGRLLDIILHQNIEFHMRHSSTSIINTVAGDVEAVSGKVLFGLVTIVSNIFVITFLLIAAFLVHPKVTFAAFIFIGTLYLVTFRIFRGFVSDAGRSHSHAAKRFLANLSEAIRGILEVKVFAVEGFFLDRHFLAASEKSHAAARSLFIAEMPRKVIELLSISVTLIFVLAALHYSGDSGNIFPFIAFFVFTAYRLLPCMQQIYHSSVQIRFYQGALERIWDTLNLRDNSDVAMSGIDYAHDILLSNVSYRYSGSPRLALDRVTISLPFGRRIAFVGKTGSGKTTAVNVILGLLLPSEGSLRVGNVDLNARSKLTVKNQVAYVAQSVVLLDDKVLNNIALGEDSPDYARAIQAAKDARLHDFIMDQLKEGYETRIGENGVRLSGGERQRLGIARALYRSPSVLVLDEATSALDNVTQRDLLMALRPKDKSRTLIFVTHRLSVIGDFDLIVYFDGGRIVDAGSFEELSYRCPGFLELVNKPLVEKFA